MSLRFDQLEPTLLEKIITKLESKSFFRLQQTCRWMNEFIRKSKHISVYLDGFYCFQFTLCKMSCQRHDRTTPLDVNFDDLYATRLNVVYINVAAEESDQYLEFLRKNKITIETLYVGEPLGWSSQYCTAFLNGAKVHRLYFYHGAPRNIGESIFQAKTLNSVDILLKSCEVVSSLPKLLSKFVEVDVRVQSNHNHFNLLQRILQILGSTPSPNLKKFQLATMINGSVPSIDILKDRLPNQKWTVGRKCGKKEISALVIVSSSSQYKIMILDKGTKRRANHTYYIFGPQANRASRPCLS